MNSAYSKVQTLDGESYSEAFRTHYPEVFAQSRAVLASKEFAEDAASEVFARLPRAIETYDPSLPFGKWLARVARKHSIDALRRRRSERRVLERAETFATTQAASPLDLVLRAELQSAVRDALASLPERYFVPSVLRYFSELSYQEIARTLGIRRARVALLIYREKARLRKGLGRRRARWLRFHITGVSDSCPNELHRGIGALKSGPAARPYESGLLAADLPPRRGPAWGQETSHRGSHLRGTCLRPSFVRDR